MNAGGKFDGVPTNACDAVYVTSNVVSYAVSSSKVALRLTFNV